jgi:hypothetical protein
MAALPIRAIPRYRCGAHLALTNNPSFLFGPSSMQHHSSARPLDVGSMNKVVVAKAVAALGTAFSDAAEPGP